MPDLKPVEQMDAEELVVEIAERRGLSCATYMADGQILVVGCPDWPRDLNAAWGDLVEEMHEHDVLAAMMDVQQIMEEYFTDDTPTPLSIRICQKWLTWKRGEESGK